MSQKVYLGIDTSCYTTSAALLAEDGSLLAEARQILSVKNTVIIGGVRFKVTAIGANAFNGYTHLKSLVITDGIKVIGDKAFYGCKSLTLSLIHI